MTTLAQFRRIEGVLGEAKGLLDELRVNAVTREDYDSAMVALETANVDLEILTDARIDPTGDGHLIEEAFAEVRRQIDELNQGKKQ